MRSFHFLKTLIRRALVYVYAFIFALPKVLRRLSHSIRGCVYAKSTAARDVQPQVLSDPALGRHMFIKINGHKYHYVESGSRFNPLVLCLHDFGDFWYGFRHQLRAFAQDFWVMALDLKGFGDSDKPFFRHHYNIDRIVSDLHQLLTSLDQPRCILIGHGLGGYIGWHFIYRYPDMVDKFVSIASPHPEIFLREATRSWAAIREYNWLYFYRLPMLPEWEMMSNDLEVFDTRYNTKNFTNLVSFSHTDIEAYKYTFCRKEDWTGPINYYRNFPLLPLEDSKEEIVPVNVQSMFVVGNENKPALEQVCQSSEYVTRFALKIIDGAGSAPHQEVPALVNRHLLKFMKDELNFRPPSPEKKPSLLGSIYDHSVKSVTNTVGMVTDTVSRGQQIVTGSVTAAVTKTAVDGIAKRLYMNNLRG